MMGVAGRVTHILEGNVTGEIVMDEGARDVPVDIGASGADVQDGQEWGAQHMEPAGTAFDVGSGFVKVFDRGHGPDPVDDVFEALCSAPAHDGDRGCGDRHGEPVVHQVGQSLLETDRTCSRSLTHAVMRGPYWTGAVAVPQKQRWARCSVVSSGCGSACRDGRSPSARRRTRRRRPDRVHSMVRGHDRHQDRSRGGPAGRRSASRTVRAAPGALRCCDFLVQAIARRRLVAGGAVERRTAFERGDAVPQGRDLPLERGLVRIKRRNRLDERRGQAQQPPSSVLEDYGYPGWGEIPGPQMPRQRWRDPPSSPLRRLGFDSHHGG